MIPEGHEPIVNFLSKVVAGDNVEAGQHFSDIMVDKINAALADQKVEVAHSMFGNNASVAEDADEDEFEEDISFLSQDEYDELPEDEKAEYEELPDGIDEENIVELDKKTYTSYLDKTGKAKAWPPRGNEDNEWGTARGRRSRAADNASKYRHQASKASSPEEKKRAEGNAARWGKTHARTVRGMKNAKDLLAKKTKGVDEENIVEYQRGLWRPPSDVNKTTGVAKTPKPAVARTVAKSPAAKPPKVKKIKPTTKPKKDRLNDYFSMPAPKKGS